VAGDLSAEVGKRLRGNSQRPDHGYCERGPVAAHGAVERVLELNLHTEEVGGSNGNGMIGNERFRDIDQKLRCWGYLSHYPDSERDAAWLLERLAKQAERSPRCEVY
jgi:hypothetical protein